MSYEAELDFAKELAYEAGKIMKRYFRAEDIDTQWKGDDTPITIADTTINKMVIETVKATYPDHGVLGEEESFEPDRDQIWIVDPIDGTVPFSLGIPISTFSIGLVNKSDGQPIVAVTYDPYLDELYSATKGGGAFVNDKPLKAAKFTDITKSYFYMSNRKLVAEGVNFRPTRIVEELAEAGAINLIFAGSVYACNRVAAGQLHAAMIGGGLAWDYAAVALIVQEAGGVVTDFRGEERRFDEKGLGCIFACDRKIHAKLLKMAEAA